MVASYGVCLMPVLYRLVFLILRKNIDNTLRTCYTGMVINGKERLP